MESKFDQISGWLFGLALAAIGVLTIGPAILQGEHVSRWRVSRELIDAAAAIDQFPNALGHWRAIGEGEPLPDEVVGELKLQGYVHRLYKRHALERPVTLLLMVGQPGPLVRHTPDICYANRTSIVLESSRTFTLTPKGESGDESEQFRVLNYISSSAAEGPFSVAYGYSTGGKWAITDWPRLEYGGFPLLYKVQVLAQQEDSTSEAKPPIDDFLHAFAEGFAEFQQGQAEGN